MRRKIRLSFTTVSACVFAVQLVVLLVYTSLFQDMTRPVRALIVLFIFSGLVTLAALAVRMARRSRIAAVVIGAVLLGLIALAATGENQMDPESLRRTYLEQLKSFSGTRYDWGGESHRGVDCSGLARAAFWQAMVSEGVRTRNPRLLGPALWRFWWHDLGASGIAACEGGYTRQICATPRLAGFHPDKLRVGDVAVTLTPMHVLIYAGDGSWIEASPDDRKVVTNRADEKSERFYFDVPVRVYRWWLLND